VRLGYRDAGAEALPDPDLVVPFALEHDLIIRPAR
jgi:hypothetical protein